MTKPAITRRSLGALLVALRPSQTAQSDLETLNPLHRAPQLQGISLRHGAKPAIPQYLLDPDVAPKVPPEPCTEDRNSVFIYVPSSASRTWHKM